MLTKQTLSEVLDQMGWPDAVTELQLAAVAPWLVIKRDGRRRASITTELRYQGYVRVRSDAFHGLWPAPCGGFITVYARTDLPQELQRRAAHTIFAAKENV
jgi:hypothetical protein